MATALFLAAALLAVAASVTSAAGCLCPMYCLEPQACGKDGRAYCNSCLAACTGTNLTTPTGPCCTDLANEVCGKDNTTYLNACTAAVTGGIHDYTEGACPTNADCICTMDYLPVCDQTTNTTYSNACLAKCSNVTTVSGACPVCECLSQIAYPVCGADQITYISPCQANCAGAVVKAKGACGDCKKQCNKGGEPVCDTKHKKYDNLCALRCAKGHNAVTGTCK